MISKNEILDLFKKEDSICQINFEKILDDRLFHGFGNGFFLKLDNEEIKDIPFNRCLITNNHILNEENIKNGRRIKIIYRKKEKIIEITGNRRVFTNKELDYTLIEILDKDKIDHFFHINKKALNELEIFKDREVFILSFKRGYDDLYYSSGKILSIKNDDIFHNCETLISGSPIIDRYDNLSILGLHYGSIQKDRKILYKKGTTISSIIRDIKDKLPIITSFNYTEKYKDLEIIGKGNFGTVYKGKIKDKTDKDNYIAIKVINKDEQKNRLRTVFNKNNIEDEFNL